MQTESLRISGLKALTDTDSLLQICDENEVLEEGVRRTVHGVRAMEQAGKDLREQGERERKEKKVER